MFTGVYVGCGGTQPLIPNKVSMDTAFAVAGAYETLCLTSAPASPRARLLFGVFSRRYENGATIVTSNLPFQNRRFSLFLRA